MTGCKVCVAAALLAVVGGLSRAVKAADEIQIRHEVWAFDPVDGWSQVVPATSFFANVGLEVDITATCFPNPDPTTADSRKRCTSPRSCAIRSV